MNLIVKITSLSFSEVFMLESKKNGWYAGGLAFQCQKCGKCCSGPDEGYIWVTRKEISLIADYLKIPEENIRKLYTKSVGLRTSLLEQTQSRDCVFLQEIGGKKGCLIYPVRPNQCRTWPFWSDNLENANSWNRAAEKCPGVNRGDLCSLDKIELLRKQKSWW